MSFIQLNPSEYQQALPLIQDDEQVFLPYALSILEGIIPGSVFVDDRYAPTCTAVILQNSRNVIARLLGNPSNHLFNTGLVEYVQREINLLEDTTGKNLNISTTTKAWENVIYHAVGYRVLRCLRTKFQFDAADFEHRMSDLAAPDLNGLYIRRIDKDLIGSNEQLTQYTETVWNGAENYLKHGGGWVALESNRMRGFCDALFVGGRQAELNISVGKSLRGRGIGSYLAIQFIRDCLDKGLVPNWTCDSDNVASYHMAQKLGFTPMRGYYDYRTQNFAKDYEPARASV